MSQTKLIGEINLDEYRVREEEIVRPDDGFRHMSPQQLVLHETIIRALQMVLNAWKHYVETEKKHAKKPTQE